MSQNGMLDILQLNIHSVVDYSPSAIYLHLQKYVEQMSAAIKKSSALA